MSRLPRKKTWAIAALSLGAVSLVVPFAGRLFGRPRVRYIYDTGALSPEDATTLKRAPGWSLSTLQLDPDLTLSAAVRRPRDRAAPWLFFLSGNDRTLLLTAQKFIERVRGDADFGAAVYAYRGYDSSSGVPAREDIAEDMRRAYQQLLQREQLAPRQVHVAAFSLGAYFAARLVGETADGPSQPASLSLLAPAEFIVMVRRSWASRVAPGDLIEMQPLLDAVPAPVLVIQGKADQTTGVEQGRTVAQKLGTRARYLELEGVGHSQLLENDEAAAAVRALMTGAAGR